MELCAAPDVPFLNTPGAGEEYKVWVTPVSDFSGDPSLVDNACGAGCFHGFRASRSKTDNFKAREQTTTPPTPSSCLRVEKQLAFAGTENTFPGPNWEIRVTDAAGVVSTFLTDELGTTGDQICGLAAGSYTVEEVMQDRFTQIGVLLNGLTVSGPSVLVTLDAGSTGDQTVVFINLSSTDT